MKTNSLLALLFFFLCSTAITAQEDYMSFYGKRLIVNSNAPVALTDESGAPLNPENIYRVHLVTTQTGTNTGAEYLVWYDQDTALWKERAVARAGNISNHALIGVENNVVVVKTNHASSYTLGVMVQELKLGETDAEPDIFGSSYQWQRLANTLYYTDGKVGIGTGSPTAKLQVDSEGSMGSKWNPSKSYLTIGNSLLIDPNEIYSEGTLYIGAKTGDILRIRSVSETGFSDKVVVKSNGNVGIGTMSPDSPLAVNGIIHSKEVRVDLEGWSDFVFEEDYDLPTLEEVEAHIKEKGHLKDIPAAREVKENGVLLGEMDAKLLQKIEELTLYTIQQQKLIELILGKTRQQELQIKKQEEEINQLKKN